MGHELIEEQTWQMGHEQIEKQRLAPMKTCSQTDTHVHVIMNSLCTLKTCAAGCLKPVLLQDCSAALSKAHQPQSQ